MHTIPLRTPLDESVLPHPAPAAAEVPAPEHGAGPSLGTVTISPEENRQIFQRLAPHLPTYLRRIENHPSGWGLRYTFDPFTGREKAPAVPRSFYDDPQLRYVREEDDPAEHKLREAADHILCALYDQAYAEWKDAAYVADLRLVIGDAPSRWATYDRAAKALEAAYAYLRTPQAAPEWPAAVSRLVDAQEQTLAAAEAFDERAEAIAHVHKRHLYADLSPAQALAEAGHPEGEHWHVGSVFDGYFSDSLAYRVRALIEEQQSHLRTVARLSGMDAG
ncbi:hypothetical protein F3K32_43165 [Streptomyces sp. LBUM 1483]|uniref:hypothetical protein n=1 Tax=Streptomyces scabiei TaxID=1930 RepID=UPI001B339503|nr:hypothetical protein [Streptomyces sp. LBUM 1483]MBP5926804.1 hypothetical protein [Streptomyces sp. LBUM 1483]